MSQSNASQVVQHLEDRLGVLLINRSTRPFELTLEGERFFEGARQIVDRYEELELQVRSLHEAVATRLTVASIYSVGLAHMSQYLREFLAEHPKADVRLEYLHPQRVYEVVESGDADLGLVSYPEESRTLEVIAWRTEPMVIVCHPAHRLASRGRAPLEAIRGEPLVAIQPGLRIREEIDRALSVRKINVKVALAFDNIETIKRAIEIDAGIGILPSPTVTREVAAGSLVQVQLAGQQLVRRLGIIHRKDRQLSEMAVLFIDLLLKHAQVPDVNGHIGDLAVARTQETPAAVG